MKQRKYDRAYLKMAQEWAKLSHCKRKKVGARIVKDIMVALQASKTPVKMKGVTQNGMSFMLKQMRYLNVQDTEKVVKMQHYMSH